MATLHGNIPPLHCYLKREFLYDGEKHHGEFEEVYAFGITSKIGWAPTFTVMTTRGAQITRLPIHALVHDTKAQAMDLDVLCLWNCFSYHFGVCRYDFLKNSQCRVFLPTKEVVLGRYLWTIDWYQDPENDTSFSEVPEGHKTGHMVMLENGNFALQPNNRIYWYNRDWVTNPFRDDERPDYQVNTRLWNAETKPRWLTADNDDFFYELLESEKKQT